jgi:hypothetical protein
MSRNPKVRLERLERTARIDTPLKLIVVSFVDAEVGPLAEPGCYRRSSKIGRRIYRAGLEIGNRRIFFLIA